MKKHIRQSAADINGLARCRLKRARPAPILLFIRIYLSFVRLFFLYKFRDTCVAVSLNTGNQDSRTLSCLPAAMCIGSHAAV